MSWQSLIKPPGKDPKNINEWLALITEKIRELKQTENWYDVSRVITTSSIVDSLDSHRSDAILSANQGRTLKELIDEIEAKITELSKNSHIDIAKLKESLDENIPKIASNIQSITDLINRLNTLSNDVTGNRRNIESINTSLTEITSKISNLESSLNVLSDRIIKNNDAITKKVEGLETKVDQNLVKVNNEIAGITSDIGQIVGGNEILTGLNVTISSENVITTTEGKVIINGDVISINKSLSINATAELLNRDYILMLTLKIDTQKQPILSLVENISADEVLISKLSIIDGKIVNNSKMEVLQPINTMIGLAAENEADTIRETIPSGFTRLGELDYEYMLNHENEVKIKSESVAYVNGYKVVIPKDTIINIGKAPEKESREDLLFLEAWKDEDFLKTGKVKWRIRYVADVDFNKFKDGIVNNVWGTQNYNFPVQAQCGNNQPIITNSWNNALDTWGYYDYDIRNKTGLKGKDVFKDDAGLYLAGKGDSTSKSKLKCIDGYSYAIPMFRLYRKPSCGKSTPFEYSKINPKVDYSKFAKLMKEEKVERVVSENIQGRSLVNLACSSSLSLTKNNYNVLIKDGLMKSNTEYTITLNISKLVGNFTSKVLQLIVRPVGGSSDTSSDKKIVIPTKIVNGKVKFKIPSQTGSISQLYIHVSGGVDGDNVSLTDIMILEGDWTNKKLPQHFEGLKSLGEDDGNLITIKNGILDDDTYDVNGGNQKLNTFSRVTHVLSENTIIPKVEADVKRGEQKLSTLTEFKKLDTIGDEKVEFTSIKGQTIRNCYPKIDRRSFSNFDGSIEDGYIILQGTAGSFKNAFIPLNKCSIKPNTKYVMIVDIVENTLTLEFVLSSVNGDDVFYNSIMIPSGTKGIHKYSLTSVDQFTEGMQGLRSYLRENETGKIKFNIMLIEGEYSDTTLEGLSYVEGLKSVGETTDNKVILKSYGKNLFDQNYILNLPSYYNGGDEARTIITTPSDDCIVMETTSPNYWQRSYRKLQLKPNTSYSLSFTKEVIKSVTESQRYHSLIVSNSQDLASSSSTTVTTKSDGLLFIGLLDYSGNGGGVGTTTKFTNIQLEEGASNTAYEPLRKNKQEIHLKEPLRGLPNGVTDELAGNKVIRRVGVSVITGNAILNLLPAYENNVSVLISYEGLLDLAKPNTENINNVISDVFTHSIIFDATNTFEGAYISNTNRLYFRIYKNRLKSINSDGIKQWFNENPVTVYYELKTPIEEYLENVYDKESIKTYQLDAPLRSLPNGVKDEIKDGVLIRRCGEIIFDGSSDEAWAENTGGATTTKRYILSNTIHTQHMKGSTNSFMCDKLISSVWSESIPIGITVGANKVFMYNKDKLTLGAFKEWLQANPIKLVYELNVEIEMKLSEVKPQSANFSLQRQFAEGKWLRELPNGVKDTIENGKVIRRTIEIVLTGNEAEWSPHSNNTEDGGTLYRYYLPMNSIATIGYKQNNLLCNNLKVVHDRPGEMWRYENIHYRIDHTQAGIYIVKDNINTLDKFKSWLKSNPVTIITTAASSTIEELSSNNFTYYPYHDINTCCGSMYIGDGRNYILNDNKMMTENPVIIENEFRKINDKSRITNCHYSKCDEGYDTFFIGNNTKNLISKTMYTNLWFMPTDPHVDHYDTTEKHYSIYNIRINPDKYYFLSSDKNLNRYNGRWMDINKKFISYFKLSGSTATYRTSALPKSPHNAHYLCLYIDSEGKLTTDDYNIQLEEGVSGTEYMDYIPISKYFENTESNDIDDLRHQVSLTGFNYSEILEKSFDSLLRGEL